MGKAIPSLRMAQSEVAAIFSICDVNDKGKPVIRCSRCEGVFEIKRGKNVQLMVEAITKAREHIAIHCPQIRSEINNADVHIRRILLINMYASNTCGAPVLQTA